jgi:hypothetical protein
MPEVKPITRESGGPRVKKLQKAVNEHLEKREFPWRKIEVDGIVGNETIDATHMACWLLGFSEEQLDKVHKGSVEDRVFLILTGQEARNAEMKERDTKRREQAKKLRKAHKERGTLAAVKANTSSGSPHYGGAADVMDQFVKPFLVGKHGLPIGSEKRTPAENTASEGSPTSDHLTTQTQTFATDFPTYSGEAAARGLAKKLEWSGWSANSYDSLDKRVDGHTFRFQILWGSAIDHDDHIHVGIRLLS